MSSEDELMISVRGLSKRYEIYDRPRDRLLQMLARGRRQYFREFWALRDVSFDIRRGETVGIIGRNGSGKSTLLQLICGTLNPTLGSISVNGRVAALLELGAGFNPEFTGRENVYLAGRLLGLTREQLDDRLPAIQEFADIGEFIDQPVKTYSSGMYVRLAFAVNAHVDADILVIDEALAVGDVYFQQKCMRYLREFKEGGGSILFVSHDTATVMALCDRAIYLSRSPDGRQHVQYGETAGICRTYLHELYAGASASPAAHAERGLGKPAGGAEVASEPVHGDMSLRSRFHVAPFAQDAHSFGRGGGRILHAWFEDADGNEATELESDRPVVLVVRVKAVHNIRFPAVGVILKDRRGQHILTESTDPHFRGLDIAMAAETMRDVRFEFTMPPLIRGAYSLDLAFADGIGDDHVQEHWLHDAILLECTEGRHVHGIVGLPNLAIAWQ